jgi:hypothetical protein
VDGLVGQRPALGAGAAGERSPGGSEDEEQAPRSGGAEEEGHG